MDSFEILKILSDHKLTLESIAQKLSLESLKNNIKDLTLKLNDPNLWANTKNAISLSMELKKNETLYYEYLRLKSLCDDLVLFLNEINLSIAKDNSEYCLMLESFSNDLDDYKIKVLLSDSYDIYDCYMKIQPGEGGVDSMDFANMLLRMYTRATKDTIYKLAIEEITFGEEAGIKSVLISIKGEYAYGYFKNESGVHRLIRISPFNSLGKRQTSFASVNVFPIIESNDDITIKDTDIRVDYFRSSGAGGQSVNTTDSAVRITHLSTNTVVTIQNERSQIQNKEKALAVLKSKLKLIEIEKKEQELNTLKGIRMETSFGSQIRSYVMHPYSLVKDLRTNVETSNVNKVLDGDIDLFIEAMLRRKRDEQQ